MKFDMNTCREDNSFSRGRQIDDNYDLLYEDKENRHDVEPVDKGLF